MAGGSEPRQGRVGGGGGEVAEGAATLGAGSFGNVKPEESSICLLCTFYVPAMAMCCVRMEACMRNQSAVSCFGAEAV